MSFNRWLLVLIMSVGLLSAGQAAEVYRWVDENGKVHFTDKKPEAVESRKVEIEYSTSVQRRNSNQANSAPEPFVDPAAEAAALSAAEARKPEVASAKLGQMTAGDCQRVYGLPCTDVYNWQEKARTQCRRDRGQEKCDDDNYLASRYKPRSLAEKLARGEIQGYRKLD